MTVRVNGGIITDQMLQGKLGFFKMTGPFTNTISNGTIMVPNARQYEAVGDTFTVPDGKPVPRSAADLVFMNILTKCTVVQIQIISATEIHFVIENTDNGWNTQPFGATSDADVNITAAIVAMPSAIVPDNSVDGVSVSFAGVTVTEVPFELA